MGFTICFSLFRLYFPIINLNWCQINIKMFLFEDNSKKKHVQNEVFTAEILLIDIIAIETIFGEKQTKKLIIIN